MNQGQMKSRSTSLNRRICDLSPTPTLDADFIRLNRVRRITGRAQVFIRGTSRPSLSTHRSINRRKGDVARSQHSSQTNQATWVTSWSRVHLSHTYPRNSRPKLQTQRSHTRPWRPRPNMKWLMRTCPLIASRLAPLPRRSPSHRPKLVISNQDHHLALTKMTR